MYFFVDTIMPNQKTGIEHAAINRLKLFKQNKAAVKIVTRNYDRTFHQYLASVGLLDSDILNMFDFFQQATQFKSRKFGINDLPQIANQNIKHNSPNKDNNYLTYQIYESEMLVAKVYTFDWDNAQINRVEYFDQFENHLRTDCYDSRGFRSLQQLIADSKRVTTEMMYTPTGQLVYESHYAYNRAGTLSNSALRLVDYQGQQELNFSSLKQLTRFFFDTINQQFDGDNLFLIDRNHELDWPILNMQTKAFKLLQLHNVQANTPDVQVGRLNFNYEYGLINQERWNGIVALGPTQQKDVMKRFTKSKVYAIGGGVIPDEVIKNPQVGYEKRIPNQAIVVARLSSEKKIEKAIQAMTIVIKSVPEATLDIYGAGKEREKLQKIIEEQKLTTQVSLKGYATDLAKVYDTAMVSVLSSDVEGLPLALIEAQSHGLPIIARDVIYGPNDIITDGEDGYLVPPDDEDVTNFAKHLIQLFTSQELWKKMSANAYQNRLKFTTEAMWEKWQEVEKDMITFYKGGQS